MKLNFIIKKAIISIKVNAFELHKFQTGKPVPGGISDSIYIDLAWGGLRETLIYDKTFPLGSVERDRIEKE